MSEFYGHSYYHTPNVREICHYVKQTNDEAARGLAIHIIAEDLLNRGVVKQGDVLIPAPQHSGKAEYTKEIADVIAAKTNARVVDILRCIPHIPLYEQRGIVCSPQIKMYRQGILPEASAYYFIDNVISTGLTFRLANELLSYRLQPLVYAVDETKNPDIGIGMIRIYEERKSYDVYY